MKLNKMKLGLMTGISVLALSASSAYAEHHEVKASILLGSKVSNGTTTIAQVDNLLLDENTEHLQYVFFEASETFDQLDALNGFVAWKDVEVRPLADLTQMELVVSNEADQKKPQDLTITRSESDHRLVSNILDEPIYFSPTQTRRIDDLLVNSNTGKVTQYAIEMDTDSLFDEDIRVIPASEVTINEKGTVRTSATLENVKMKEKYQLSSL